MKRFFSLCTICTGAVCVAGVRRGREGEEILSGRGARGRREERGEGEEPFPSFLARPSCFPRPKSPLHPFPFERLSRRLVGVLTTRDLACFSNRNKKIQLKILITKARVVANKPVHFGLLTDSFLVLSAKIFKPPS